MMMMGGKMDFGTKAGKTFYDAEVTEFIEEDWTIVFRYMDAALPRQGEINLSDVEWWSKPVTSEEP